MLEETAKKKEQMLKIQQNERDDFTNDEINNLIIDSMKAKLAILDDLDNQ